MPFDGNGNWTSNFSAVADRDANIKILASRFDGILLADIAQSFENCLTKDTQVKPQQPFNANNYRVINVANPENDKDAVNLQYLNQTNHTFTGDNTFSGTNTFTGNAIFKYGDLSKWGSYTLGTTPASNILNQYHLKDANGTVTGAFEQSYASDGTFTTRIVCKSQNGSNNSSFGVGWDSGGNEIIYGSNGVKKALVNLGMPNYDSGVSKSSGTNYTATSNGFLYVEIHRSSGNSGTLDLKIGNTTFNIHSQDYDWNACLFPIAKGVTYSLTLSGVALEKAYFYPCYGG